MLIIAILSGMGCFLTSCIFALYGICGWWAFLPHFIVHGGIILVKHSKVTSLWRWGCSTALSLLQYAGGGAATLHYLCCSMLEVGHSLEWNDLKWLLSSRATILSLTIKNYEWHFADQQWHSQVPDNTRAWNRHTAEVYSHTRQTCERWGEEGEGEAVLL